MTKETLDELRALLAEATPGPWTAHTDGTSWVEAEEDGFRRFPATDCREQDAALIAAAVNVLPELLDTIDAQREECDDMVRAFCRAAGVERDDHGQAVERVTKMRADIDAQRGQLDAIEGAIIGHDDEDMKHPKCTVAELVKRVLVERDAQREEIAELEAENARLAKYVLNSGHRAPDYACSACVPGGRINVPGFACTWHAALARIDALRKEGK